MKIYTNRIIVAFITTILNIGIFHLILKYFGFEWGVMLALAMVTGEIAFYGFIKEED